MGILLLYHPRERRAALTPPEKPVSPQKSEPSGQTQTVIPSGRQLGSYQVRSLLGKGGMGEVYRAHDPKLARDVAIKTLPAEFAGHAEWLARFQREARMLAALNHPNIAALYGLEESGGVHYLVMELVEGETLAERLHRASPLAPNEALEICAQVAEALQAAHEKSITHRDIKPANIR